MNDIMPLDPGKRERLDRLLGESLPRPSGLGDDFEDSVMERLQDPLAARVGGRRVYLVMALYWCVAALAGSWLLGMNQGALVAQGDLFAVVLASTAFTGFAAAWWLLRKSGLRLNELFLGTLR